MFIRTANLLLRPAWPEDAAQLAAAFGQPTVVMTLANAPWPYCVDDAADFIAYTATAALPELLIVAPASSATLIGGIGLVQRDAAVELGYWIKPGFWGRGYATEAGRALVNAAGGSLKLERLIAAHFVDNAASRHVLQKLGFACTGVVAPRHCRARGLDVACVEYALDLRTRHVAA